MRTPNKLTEMTNSDFESAIKKATLSVLRGRRILLPYEKDGKEIGIGVGIDEEKEDIDGYIYDNVHSEEKESVKERKNKEEKEKRTDRGIGYGKNGKNRDSFLSRHCGILKCSTQNFSDSSPGITGK